MGRLNFGLNGPAMLSGAREISAFRLKMRDTLTGNLMLSKVYSERPKPTMLSFFLNS